MVALVNPFLKFRASNPWSDAHPAVDYATPIGTRFVAPGDGVYRRLPSQLTRTFGMAGHYSDLILTTGQRIRFCHLNRHIAADGARVFIGETVLAETGNTGYVKPSPDEPPYDPSAGAHMHTTGFLANGSRWNWTLYAGAMPAGSEIDMPLTDDDIRRIWAYPVQRKDGPVKVIQEIADTKTALTSLAQEAADAVWARPIRRGDTVVSAVQELADAKTQGILANEKLAQPVAPIDYERLAAAIVEAGGKAPTVEEIAKAVNDDFHARTAD